MHSIKRTFAVGTVFLKVAVLWILAGLLAFLFMPLLNRLPIWWGAVAGAFLFALQFLVGPPMLNLMLRRRPPTPDEREALGQPDADFSVIETAFPCLLAVSRDASPVLTVGLLDFLAEEKAVGDCGHNWGDTLVTAFLRRRRCRLNGALSALLAFPSLLKALAFPTREYGKLRLSQGPLWYLGSLLLWLAGILEEPLRSLPAWLDAGQAAGYYDAVDRWEMWAVTYSRPVWFQALSPLTPLDARRLEVRARKAMLSVRWLPDSSVAPMPAGASVQETPGEGEPEKARGFELCSQADHSRALPWGWESDLTRHWLIRSDALSCLGYGWGWWGLAWGFLLLMVPLPWSGGRELHLWGAPLMGWGFGWALGFLKRYGLGFKSKRPSAGLKEDCRSILNSLEAKFDPSFSWRQAVYDKYYFPTVSATEILEPAEIWRPMGYMWPAVLEGSVWDNVSAQLRPAEDAVHPWAGLPEFWKPGLRPAGLWLNTEGGALELKGLDKGALMGRGWISNPARPLVRLRVEGLFNSEDLCLYVFRVSALDESGCPQKLWRNSSYAWGVFWRLWLGFCGFLWCLLQVVRL